MGGHDVHFVERLRAVGAFSHAVGDTVLHTVVAEEMAASLEDRVFEVLSADGAKRKSLGMMLEEFQPVVGIDLLSASLLRQIGCPKILPSMYLYPSALARIGPGIARALPRQIGHVAWHSNSNCPSTSVNW